MALKRSDRGCCWNAQQILESEKVVQTSKILFAYLDCLSDASVVELIYQLKTGGDFGTKFRLRVSDPCAQATFDLRPLYHTEYFDPFREAVCSGISNQFPQR